MESSLVVDGLVEYTPSQIESKVLEYRRRRVDVPTNIPVDIELLLGRTQDVIIETCYGLALEHSVEGCVCNERTTRTLTVFVDQKIANGSVDANYNEVLAEELAHIELHRAIIYQIDSVDMFIAARQHPLWQRIESDADRFSMALRIPALEAENKAKAAYWEIVDSFGFQDAQSVLKQVRNKLAERFVVPIQTMTRRLARWPLDWIPKSIHASVLAESNDLLSQAELRGIRQSFRQSSFIEND